MLPDYVFEEAYRRVQEELGVGTQQQMAERLGISQASVCSARVRKSIPAGWLLQLLLRRKLNPLWVLHGDVHKKYLQPTDEVTDDASDSAGFCGVCPVVPSEAVSGSAALVLEVQ